MKCPILHRILQLYTENVLQEKLNLKFNMSIKTKKSLLLISYESTSPHGVDMMIVDLFHSKPTQLIIRLVDLTV